MKLTVLFVIFFLLIDCRQVVTNTENEVHLNEAVQTQIVEKLTEDCVTMDFHYLVTENVLYSSKVRHIEVFLDENAFSEENLRKLFTYLADKNPEPKQLTLEVKTNWKQLHFPSDCPGTGSSNMPERPDKYDYYQATFYRRGNIQNIEYFEYYPTLRTKDMKTVIMKGKE